MNREDDDEFQESAIEKVRETESSYELTHNGAWVIGCPKVDGLPAPRVGETLRTYGRGIGSVVRGIVVDGRVYRYRTAVEQRADEEREHAERQAQAERDFLANQEAVDARIAALPALFRERLAKFQRDGGHEFRRDYEAYELFCCEQAVVIADALKTPEAIRAFCAAEWDEQKRLVPALSTEHSGNTFGMAALLARTYVEKPEFVPKQHGALTPLVGCQAYGCKHEEPVTVDAVAKGDEVL